MAKTTLRSSTSHSASCDLSLSDLKRYGDAWLQDSKYRQLSEQTRYNRGLLIEKLQWWLQQQKCAVCGTLEIKQFLAYVGNGHNEQGGRWGNAQLTRAVRPRTVKDYHGNLRTFFKYLVEEGYLDVSPMENVKPPVSRADQIVPFTQEQVNALLQAAKTGNAPLRDEALILFLMDGGVRASELCSLTMQDIDVVGKRATVLGKGNKHRTVYFGRDTSRAVMRYLKTEERKPSDPVFKSERGEALTRSGLLQLIHRLGRAAKIEATRCSPHTFRHTFAVEFLRGGGQVFALQQILGHTQLGMTQKYVAIAQADVQNQHLQFSPVERLRNKGGRK